MKWNYKLCHAYVGLGIINTLFVNFSIKHFVKNKHVNNYTLSKKDIITCLFLWPLHTLFYSIFLIKKINIPFGYEIGYDVGYIWYYYEEDEKIIKREKLKKEIAEKYGDICFVPNNQPFNNY